VARPRPARSPTCRGAACRTCQPCSRNLKSKGLWVYGAAAEGASLLYDTDLTGPAAIVIGSEETAWAGSWPSAVILKGASPCWESCPRLTPPPRPRSSLRGGQAAD
jgi:hypothetical protein